MANELKFILTADGKSVIVEVDGVGKRFDELGQKASAAAKKADSSFGATRQGLISISEQLKAAEDAVVGFGKAYVAAFVGGKAMAIVSEMAMLNARFQELGVVMPVVGRNAGYTATQMNAAAESMQRAGISMLESRNTAIQLAQAQISLADASKLARIAQDAAVVGNMNSSEALNQMIYGIKSGQIEVLRTMGINVNFEQSYKALAAQLHVSTEALSEHQKMQARENAVLDEGTKLTGAYEAAMGTAGKQMRSMARYAEDLKVMRGEVFNEALTVGVMAFVDQLKEANAETVNLAQNQTLAQWGADVADSLAFAADAAMKVYATFRSVGDAIGWLGAQMMLLRMPTNTKAEMQAYWAARDAINEESRARQAAYDKMDTMFSTSLEKRRAAQRADNDARVKLEVDYAQRSLIVSKAYANASLAIQQKAQMDLARAMYPAEFPDKPKDAPVVKATSARSTANPFAAEQEAAKEWAKAIEDADKAYNKATASASNLSESERALRDYLASTAATINEKTNPAMNEMVKARYASAIAQEKQNKAQEVAVKAYEDYQKAQEKILDGYKNSADAAEKSLQKYLDEETAIGIATQKNISLAQALEEVGLARVREAYAKVLSEGGDGQTLLALQKEIAAREKLIKAIGGKEARDANKKAADDAAAAWKKTSDQIEQSITDALMRGFENGKGFAENMRDTIVNMFKTMVLRPVVQAVVQGGTNIASQLGSAAGIASSGGGGSSILSMASSASNFFSGGATGGFMSGFSSGMELAAGGFGADVASAGAAMMESATGFSSFAAGAGQALAGGASSFAAALGPVGIAIAGIGILAALFGGKSYISAGDTGDSSKAYNAQGALTYDHVTAVASQTASDYVSAIQATYATTAKSLGVGAVDTYIGYGSNSGREAQNPNFNLLVNANGQQVHRTQTNDPNLFGPNEIALNQGNLQLEASRAVIAALSGSTLPKYLSGVFDGLVVPTATQAQLDSVLQTAQSFKILYDTLQQFPFQNITDVSYATLSSLVAFSGGMDKLGQNLSTYYTNFYSADEQKANTIKSINKALSDAGGSIDVSGLTRATFRGIVENTDKSSPLFAALLQVSGAFASITPAAANAVAAVDQVAEKLAATNKSWQDKLDVLTGARTQEQVNLANDLAGATDESTKALIRQVYAQEDFAAAAAQTAETLRNAIATAKSSQASAVQKYTAPLNGTTAGAMLGGDVVASIQGKSSEQIREMALQYVSSLTDQTVAGRAAIAQFEKLTPAIDFFVSAADTAVQAIKDQTSAAFAGVQRAVDAQRKVVQTQLQIANESVGSLKSIFDTLKGGIQNLYNSASSLSGYNTATATSFLQQALSTAQASGYLPDATQLADAVSAAVSGTTSAQYATQSDAEFAKLSLAGTMGKLKDLTGSQLSVADQAVKLAQGQLDTLDATLQTAQDQLDALNGVDKSVQSVGAAMAALAAAIGAQSSISASAAGSIAAGTSTAAVDLGRITTAGGQYASGNSYSGQQVVDEIKFRLANGLSPDQVLSTLQNDFGGDPAQVRRIAKLAGLPGFAAGINRVPENMLAMLHKDEAVFPATYNPFNPNAQGGGMGNSDILAELRAVRAEVAALRSDNSAENKAIATHTQGTKKALDRVMPDGDALATRAAV